MLRALRRYRSIPALAALAVLVGAFAPAPPLPCAPTAESPASAGAPCHRMDPHETATMAPAAPEAPPARHVPALPQPDRLCCPSKAPLAPTPEQPTPVAAVVVQSFDVADGLAPASLPRPVLASDASPPEGPPLHLLFGCFLT